MDNFQQFPPPQFSSPTKDPIVRPPVFNWQPPYGNFHSGSGHWLQPPTGQWFRNPPLNYYRAPGHQESGVDPNRNDWHWNSNTGYQHFQENGYKGRNKKNKREQVFSHFCDTCDRGFKNQDKYEEHLAQHVKCSVEGCSFTAHEKLVSIHWKNTHTPGAKKIKLDTAEEIAKWREERRKNYPTLANVEKKQKIMADRVERGEVLETAQFGRMRGRGRGFRQRGGRFPNNPRIGWTRPGALHHMTEEPQVPPLKETSKDGDPLGAIVHSDTDSDKDETADGREDCLTVTPKHVTSGLSALVSYDSSSESDDDQGPEALPVLKVSKVLEENQDILKSLPESVQRQPPPQGPRATPAPGIPWPRSTPSRRGRGGRTPRGQIAPRHCRPTLLEMLLAPEIRHERNVLLQCVRFIVRNGFFGLDDGTGGDKALSSKSVAALEGKQQPQTETQEDGADCLGQNITPDGNAQPGPNLTLQNMGIGGGQNPSEACSLGRSAQDYGQDTSNPGSLVENILPSTGDHPVDCEKSHHLHLEPEEKMEYMFTEAQNVDGDVHQSKDGEPGGSTHKMCTNLSTQDGGYGSPKEDLTVGEGHNAQPSISVVDEDVGKIPEVYIENS